MDLNHWPPGYEPGELPDCSTPQQYTILTYKRSYTNERMLVDSNLIDGKYKRSLGFLRPMKR